MLVELHVRDLALVEDVWLEFGPGLTALSGETGAGKTVLVTALKLLLGERADAGFVREGSAEAVVEGRFVFNGEEVLVRRRISAEGRSRCSLNGEMATVAMLAEQLGGHVDLHGQHEHQALLHPARHAGYLDRFIGEPAHVALECYRTAWREAAVARGRVDELRVTLADRDRRADYLRFMIADIDAVAPAPGEREEIEARLPRMRHGGRLAAAASTAWNALNGDDGASDHLSTALHALGSARDLDPALDALAQAASEVDMQLQDVAASLRAYAESIEHDPAGLEAAESRLHVLADLGKKYGSSLSDVLHAREAAVRELGMLDEGEAGLERAEAAVLQAAAALRAAGEDLSSVRADAVDAFADSLRAAAADLALPSATFAVSRTPLPFEAWTSDGPERIEFLFASSSGETPRPLAKVASGGEVSRVMLALKSVLGAADFVEVLVFDEVDAGIGGATALAVGRRLAALAAGHQVLVITHLPQVAAFADAHVVVEKGESGGRTVTTARRVSASERTTEIARMLAGEPTAVALAHAAELLESAGSAASRKGQPS